MHSRETNNREIDMKAKYIRKIRERARWFHIACSKHLFGSPYWGYGDRVLGYDHENALCRYLHRNGHGNSRRDECSEQWGRWKVKEVNKPEHHRFVKYY